jgi:hypothetical protein
MDDLFRTVLDYFAWKGWPVEVNDRRDLLRLRYETAHGHWHLYARALADTGQLIFYSVLPNPVAPTHHPLVAEYLHRANHGLPIGNFELDYADGEVRFRTSIPLGNMEPHITLIDALVQANLATMEDYLPGLHQIIAGTQTPATAIQIIRTEMDNLDFLG